MAIIKLFPAYLLPLLLEASQAELNLGPCGKKAHSRHEPCSLCVPLAAKASPFSGHESVVISTDRWFWRMNVENQVVSKLGEGCLGIPLGKQQHCAPSISEDLVAQKLQRGCGKMDFALGELKEKAPNLWQGFVLWLKYAKKRFSGAFCRQLERSARS